MTSSETRAEAAVGIAGVATVAGTLAFALFPLAIPFVALTVVALLPLALPVVVLAVLGAIMAAVWTVMRSAARLVRGDRESRRPTRAGAPARPGTALGS